MVDGTVCVGKHVFIYFSGVEVNMNLTQCPVLSKHEHYQTSGAAIHFQLKLFYSLSHCL